jgi:hypothetical protein
MPHYASDGVDVTLIEWMLSLTPAEGLAVLQDFVDGFGRIRSQLPTDRFISILDTLVRNKVDFIVVGGVAAVLCRVPLSTFDFEIVHSTAPENLTRVEAALEELDAFGPLDLLGAIGNGRTYDDLKPHASDVALRDDLHIAVLDLETLIAVKEETAGEKDLAMLPILRRTLEESRRRR